MSSRFSSLFGSIAALNEKQLKGWRMEQATMEFRNVEMLRLKTHLRYISDKEPVDEQNAVINLYLALKHNKEALNVLGWALRNPGCDAWK